MHKPDFFLENETHDVLWDFEILTDHLISARWPDLVIINNNNKKRKKRTCWTVDFAVPADHRINLRESEKKDKDLHLAREVKKQLWNMMVMVILIVAGALGTILKGLVKGLENLEIRVQLGTIQTTALIKSAWILRRVQENWGNLELFKIQWKAISYRGWENSQRRKMIKIITFAVPADYRVNIKENEKRDKYFDLARELKKLCNMKVIAFLVDAFATVPKGLVKRPEDLKLRGQLKTIQTTVLFRLVRILRKVPETWGHLLLLRLLWKIISQYWCKTLARNNMIWSRKAG